MVEIDEIFEGDEENPIDVEAEFASEYDDVERKFELKKVSVKRTHVVEEPVPQLNCDKPINFVYDKHESTSWFSMKSNPNEKLYLIFEVDEELDKGHFKIVQETTPNAKNVAKPARVLLLWSILVSSEHGGIGCTVNGSYIYFVRNRNKCSETVRARLAEGRLRALHCLESYKMLFEIEDIIVESDEHKGSSKDDEHILNDLIEKTGKLRKVRNCEKIRLAFDVLPSTHSFHRHVNCGTRWLGRKERSKKQMQAREDVYHDISSR
ncbi:hypothetical protein HDE_07564 [Halotydeus destructor]|nr:hypothetical protein HDE_07564 [Halotydeus destructor]